MEKLGKFADLIEFKIELDPAFLRQKITNGVRYEDPDKQDKWKIAPRQINENITVMSPYDHSEQDLSPFQIVCN